MSQGLGFGLILRMVRVFDDKEVSVVQLNDSNLAITI
jgi:hypothetical protein